MKLCFWRSTSGNFGDQLNLWLWPRVLPDFFDERDDVMFLGMGSLLGTTHLRHYHFLPDAVKLVFGTGYGGITFGAPPKVDDRWKIYFVRGPRTAKALGVHPELGIGDPGSLISRIPETLNLPRLASGPAFMPHLESAANGAWKSIAEAAGLAYIDPRSPVESILRDLASASVVVTEAMHGAIVADALRIPWVPFAPSEQHQAKWHDWADSLGISITFARRAPATLAEALSTLLSRSPRNQRRFSHYAAPLFHIHCADELFRTSAIRALERAARAEPMLSTDANLRRATDLMLQKIEDIRSDYPRKIHERLVS